MCRRMMEEIDIYAEARRRINIGLPVRKVQPGPGPEYGRKASRKYARTEKGKETNRRKCKEWQKAHPGKVKLYVDNFRKKFFEKYGMKYCTYMYRLKRGLPVPELDKEKNDG